MWATFWRSRADVEGYENARGDPWWGRLVRCVGEGVETTTPSPISNLLHPNSFIYEFRRFRKPAKDVVSPPTTHFPHNNHPRAKHVVSPPRSTLPCDIRTHLLHTLEIATAWLVEHTTAIPAWLCSASGCGRCLERWRKPCRNQRNCRTRNANHLLYCELGLGAIVEVRWRVGHTVEEAEMNLDGH